MRRPSLQNPRSHWLYRVAIDAVAHRPAAPALHPRVLQWLREGIAAGIPERSLMPAAIEADRRMRQAAPAPELVRAVFKETP